MQEGSHQESSIPATSLHFGITSPLLRSHLSGTLRWERGLILYIVRLAVRVESYLAFVIMHGHRLVLWSGVCRRLKPSFLCRQSMGILVEVSARQRMGQLEADEVHISSAPVQATRPPCQDPGGSSASTTESRCRND